MSAKDRAINKALKRADLESFVAKNGQLDPIQLRRLRRWEILDSKSNLAPADINDLWQYVNDQLKHLDPKQTIDGVLLGEHDPIIRELFEARRGIYLAQLELFELLDNPREAEDKVSLIQSLIEQHYATLQRTRNA